MSGRISTEDCEHAEVCGCKALEEHDGKCILHSEDLDKDENRFEEALEEHREEHEGDFRLMVFPGEAEFTGATFELANFENATFDKADFEGTEFGNAYFSGVTFGVVNFENAKFDSASFKNATFEEADFRRADFDFAHFWDATFEKAIFESATFEEVLFNNATFKEADPVGADFVGATFNQANFENANFEKAAFWHATFEKAEFEGAIFGGAYFHNATFGEVDFTDAVLKKAYFERSTFEDRVLFDQCFKSQEKDQFVEARFTGCEFNGDVLFSGTGEENRVFAGGNVNFRNVTVAPESSLHYRYADLSRCSFLRTDLRDVEFTGVKWCEKVSSDGRYFDEWFRRVGIYDEAYGQNRGEYSTPPWPEIERLYRQLKSNYEDRGDFPRAGDFHIGEKVARRQNSQTHWGAQFLLTVYRALSKYGERALPAAFWLVALVLVCALGYLSMGGVTDSVWLTSWTLGNWWDALVLSGEATLFPVRAAGFHQIGPRALNLVQRAISPVLIALLALALRQRVKR
ncbi:pentapeptide repeat-containing protein [Salinibacter altiplanensis]|uniref:pentapeptide repeat-containing protein n=1 Tax=Salinibacter altiplanensis TaxID=1803181 RepID=UPI000C9ECA34|nr:pentapeptide repeat-containing protein [Salinibacter altiplanensis]